MSIIHDALKKVQKGEEDKGSAPPRKAGSEISVKKVLTLSLVSLALIAGVLAVGAVMWRSGVVSKRARQNRPVVAVSNPIISNMTPPAATKPIETSDQSSGVDEIIHHAERLFMLGEYSIAEKELRAVLGQSSDREHEIRNSLGIILKKQGKLDEALEQYNLALSLSPDFIEAINNRAVVYRKQGKYTEAEKELKRVLEIDPAYPEAQFNLATVYEAKKMQGKALEAYKKYINNPSRISGLDETIIRQRITNIEADLAIKGWNTGSRGR